MNVADNNNKKKRIILAAGIIFVLIALPSILGLFSPKKTANKIVAPVIVKRNDATAIAPTVTPVSTSAPAQNPNNENVYKASGYAFYFPKGWKNSEINNERGTQILLEPPTSSQSKFPHVLLQVSDT